MKSALRVTVAVIRPLLTTIGAIAVAVVVLTWPSNRVVAWWDQPAGLAYDQFDPYALAVVDRGRDLCQIPWGRRYDVFAGRSRDITSYGHWAAFPYVGYQDDPDAFVRRCKVRWAQAGVTLLEPSGHRLLVPKAMFTGGR